MSLTCGNNVYKKHLRARVSYTDSCMCYVRTRLSIDKYNADFHKLALTIMRLIVEGMQPQVNLAHFQPYLTEQFGVLRVNFYPVSNHPAQDIGLPPHIDDNMLTIVHQGCDDEGLELIKDGQWVSVPPRRDALIVLVAAVCQVRS
jgi:isopenicillin N synthase-like dioxygenase